MFSLHIDTARTWRGGQNQVLMTVNGLRSIGHRAALVAHPDGELRRRAAEGLDLIPIAPRTEMDLSAAWRLARVIKRLQPDVVHAAPAVNLHEALWLPHHAPVVGNVAALVPHKGQRHLIEAAHLVVQEVPDARFLILGEGELREPLERQVRDHHLEKHVLLPGFRTDVLGCIKGFDLFAMSSVTEGLGTSLLDAMACSRAIAATTAGGIPEIVEEGVNGSLVPPRDPVAMAHEIVRLLRDEALRRRMGEAGYARVSARFTVERMVEETAAVYARVAGRRHATDIENQPA